jgi:Dolichyl-phosphate-mannose-protein mannosyltransferase
VILTFLAILVAVVLGTSVVILFWSASTRRSDRPVMIFLAMGIGLGISSCLFFLWISAFQGRHTGFARTEALLAILLSICAIVLRRHARESFKDLHGAQPEMPQRQTNWILTASFLIALLVATISFTHLSIAAPHGSFDAWGIWNLHAKFLFVNDPHWRDGFSKDLAWSHPDYPLLVPASIARCWSYTATENTLAPICISALFTLATIGLLVSALSLLTTLSQGLLAGTLLLCTPFFVMLGAAQYADAPLGFFLLATIVLFSLSKRTKGILILAGITAGLAAWTKNEGILFVLSFLLAHLIQSLRTRHWREYSRELAVLAAGFLPILTVLIYFKSGTATYNDLFSQPGTLLHRLIQLSRYRTILKALLSESFNFGAWFVSIVPCIMFYFLLVGTRNDVRKHDTAICYLALAFTAAGYLMIYVIAPFSLDWLLASSLNRLLIQLWPSILFLVFLRARNPEEVTTVHASR